MKKGLLGVVAGVGTGLTGVFGVLKYKEVRSQYNTSREIAKKNDSIIKLFNRWMNFKSEGGSIAQKLQEEGYNKVAIYGMGCVGERLVDELKDSNIEIAYGIDKNADKIICGIDMFTPEERLPNADVVIVTAVYYFDAVEEQLWEHISCPIISLSDLITE